MSKRTRPDIGRAFCAAFPCTVPILTGFLFLGMTCGVCMNAAGFGGLYPALCAMTVFGGSLEFVIPRMLGGPFAPVQTLAVAVLIQARHLFYGLSMLERYKGLGWKKPFLIFWMCDETFSVNCTAEIPEGVDRGWFYFFVSALDYAAWVCGTALGGALGALAGFAPKGLEFCMTAMFAVIFTEQWLKERSKFTSLLGLGAAGGCLAVFGPQNFMIPAMAVILVSLAALRGPAAKAGGYE